MADISLESVSFTYPGAAYATLRELDLRVADGSTHALLGASGAGKTTILNILCGLLQPTQGRILFNERDVSALGARERNVALVFQFPVLYESKSVLDNLTFPLRNRGWSEEDAVRRARDVASDLEISDVLSARPSELSLFQKQLTAIAKSLVRTDVDLVLLDEPLTAVEPAMKWRLRQTLSRYQAHHKLTMIYVTHDQTEALTFASRVSVMADGCILQTGTPEEIYNAPTDEFVGNFIGSPGMQFYSNEALRGLVTLTGAESSESTPSPITARSRIGLRAEWLNPDRHDAGPWEVVGKRLLGTHQGSPKSLLTLRHGELEVFARALAHWDIGDRASLRAGRWLNLHSGAHDAK
ncbi:MAG: ABC transporter ATP-binding protein [Congregibacter sp.]